MFTCIYNVAPQNHIEEKPKKFKTSRINKSPSHYSFDTGTVLNLKRPQGHIFFFISMREKQFQLREKVFIWKKNYLKSFSTISESILMTHLSISF